jgi:hypothetical protein
MSLLTSDLVFFAARYLLLLFAFVVLGFAFAHWRRAARRDAERLFEQVDIAISRLNVLEESLAEQHARLEQRLQNVQSQTRLAAAAASGPGQRQYETAIRLARAGTSREELMASCAVTRHEAELLLRLHAPRAPAAETPVTKSAARAAPAVAPAAPAARLATAR